MTDVVDKQTRSRMMSGIRGKNTKPELALRKALHARGYRYRLHAARMPGRPDLVLQRYRAAIFVHGCFWHRHDGCRFTTFPSTRWEFWQAKFQSNVRRDQEVLQILVKEGWRVAVVWECSLRRTGQITVTADLLEKWLTTRAAVIEIGESNSAGHEMP